MRELREKSPWKFARSGGGSPPPQIDWRPFTVTVGDSGDWLGYSSGDIPSPPFNPPVGSISNSPIQGTALEALYFDPGAMAVIAIFHGDIASSLTGFRVQIDNDILETSGAELISGNTWARFPAPGFGFNNGETYGVVFSG